MKFVSAIHGINTGLTDPAWPWRLQGMVVNDGYLAGIQTEHYKAGPFPFWNTRIKNPRLARAYANRLLLIDEQIPICLVAHSNGADIAVRVIASLDQVGRKVDTVILIGAAIESCIKKSGLLELVENGAVENVIAYASDSDQVVSKLEWLGGSYGALGYKGFRDGKAMKGLYLEQFEENTGGFPFVTRRFPGYGHSGYFDKAVQQETFELILRDLKVL